MKKQDVTTFVWGLVAGGIAVSIALFSTGWAVRSDTAAQNARMMSQSAVAASLAEVCVAQFEDASDKGEKLAAMKKLDSWKRGEYVSQQGWATMPGSVSGDSQVARQCAQLLEEIES